MKKKSKPLEDLLELGTHALTLREIEFITSSEGVRRIYERRLPGQLYSTILMSLTHKAYPEAEAAAAWKGIQAHREALHRVLRRDVGLSVAALDYLTNIKETLDDPKIIEDRKSSFVAQATTTDALTGLYLRDVFDVVLHKEMHEVRRRSSPLSLLMIDIDDFKRVNDRHGHPAGDRILRSIGDCLRGEVREMDLAARYGGEELAVVMPETAPEQAARIGERIRERIRDLRVDGVRVTVSIGVAGVGPCRDTPKKLVEAADEALYAAKRAGKDRVEMA